jgi:hypothetical protein
MWISKDLKILTATAALGETLLLDGNISSKLAKSEYGSDE